MMDSVNTLLQNCINGVVEACFGSLFLAKKQDDCYHNS